MHTKIGAPQLEKSILIDFQNLSVKKNDIVKGDKTR